jgi:quercetin dioxygenase-like cupin family protein
VRIIGGIFSGCTGHVEEVLPSGKLQVRVEARGTISNARIDPVFVEPLGTLIEENESDEQPRIKGLERWDEESYGPPMEQAIRSRLEAKGFRVSRYVYPPGTSFPEHTHPVDKIDAVVSGRFRMTREGDEIVLEAGDWLSVPRGTPHSAEVVGDEPVVSLDGIQA